MLVRTTNLHLHLLRARNAPQTILQGLSLLKSLDHEYRVRRCPLQSRTMSCSNPARSAQTRLSSRSSPFDTLHSGNCPTANGSSALPGRCCC